MIYAEMNFEACDINTGEWVTVCAGDAVEIIDNGDECIIFDYNGQTLRVEEDFEDLFTVVADKPMGSANSVQYDSDHVFKTKSPNDKYLLL